MKRFLSVIFVITICSTKAWSQNPLPDFSADDLGGNKIRISWLNPYNEGCIQLMVQASYDSVKNFKTIFSTESPQLPQNGFVYQLAYQAKLYYRVFYILEGNAYYFTKPKRASAVQFPSAANEETQVIIQEQTKIDPIRIITIKTKDSIIARVSYSDYWRFKDSIAKNTKDTLFVLTGDQVLLKPFNPENYFRPSPYVVTNRDGYVVVKLPEAGEKNYRLIFFDTDGKKLFTINHITDTELVIDKTNFVHAGWFKFELYENDKLKEKNKILLQRDF